MGQLGASAPQPIVHELVERIRLIVDRFTRRGRAEVGSEARAPW